MRLHHAAVVASLVLAFSSAGCDRDEPVIETEQPSQSQVPEVEGLSREELRSRAEPMSPEQAEQLGIIDTTIHVERQMSTEDSLLLSDTISQRDTTLR